MAHDDETVEEWPLPLDSATAVRAFGAAPTCAHVACGRPVPEGQRFCCHVCGVSHRATVARAHTALCEMAERARIRAAVERAVSE